MKENIFNSKILLFGEYSILANSKGLSIPFPLFNGSLKTPLEKTESWKIASMQICYIVDGKVIRRNSYWKAIVNDDKDEETCEKPFLKNNKTNINKILFISI